MCASRNSPSNSLKAVTRAGSNGKLLLFFRNLQILIARAKTQPIAYFSGIRALIVAAAGQVNVSARARKGLTRGVLKRSTGIERDLPMKSHSAALICRRC